MNVVDQLEFCFKFVRSISGILLRYTLENLLLSIFLYVIVMHLFFNSKFNFYLCLFMYALGLLFSFNEDNEDRMLTINPNQVGISGRERKIS